MHVCESSLKKQYSSSEVSLEEGEFLLPHSIIHAAEGRPEGQSHDKFGDIEKSKNVADHEVLTEWQHIRDSSG